jgi:phage terminase large subunit-like protein
MPNLTDYQKAVSIFANDFYTKARPNQIIDFTRSFKWYGWIAGRAFGKTWSLNNNIFLIAALTPNSQWGIIAPTYGDLTKVTMEGSSGLKSLIPIDCLLGRSWDTGYNKSEGKITLGNNTIIWLVSADKPERLRGHNWHGAGFEEFAAFDKIDYVIQMVEMAVRIGDNPAIYFATTPRPKPAIKALLKKDNAIVIRGSTAENKANISKGFYDYLVQEYGGTRIGRQELEAEILEDVEGALWTYSMIDKAKNTSFSQDGTPITPDNLQQIVIAIDPSGGGKDECGIIVCGKDASGFLWVLEDASITTHDPNVWANRAVNLYEKYNANCILAETNFGAKMVKSVIENVSRQIPFKEVTATKAKHVRAEPIAQLYSREMVKHLYSFPKLEDQLVNFTSAGYVGIGSPDRADALVWGLTYLSQQNKQIRAMIL